MSVMPDAPSGAASRDTDTAGVFSRTIVFWMVVIGVAAFAAFLVLITYADELRKPEDTGPHALSKSAVGYAGLVRLLNDIKAGDGIVSRGDDETWSRGLNVLTPSGPYGNADLDYSDFAEPALIILPKWVVFPDFKHRGWVARSAPYGAQTYALNFWGETVEFSTSVRDKPAPMEFALQTETDIDAADAPDFAYDDGYDEYDEYEDEGFVYRDSMIDRLRLAGVARFRSREDVDSFQTLSGEDLAPILVSPDGGIVLGRIIGSNAFVLSDPELINNTGLSDADRAALSVRLLDALRDDGPVFFDLTLHGMERSRNLLKLAFEPPFSAATLAALLAVCLLAWRAATRFGPTVREGRAFALGKRALADNSAGPIRLANREHRYAAGYAELSRKAAARAASAPRTLTGDALDRFLDQAASRRTQTPPPASSDLVREAVAADNRASLMRVARKLYAWRQEFARERH